MKQCPVCLLSIWGVDHDGVLRQDVSNDTDVGTFFVCQGQLVFQDRHSGTFAIRDDRAKIAEITYLSGRAQALFF